MFWDSVFGGLKVLTHWQVWCAVVIYMVIMFAFLMLCGGIAGNEESGGRKATGCLTYLIGGVFIQAFLMSFIIAVLFPILLGGTSTIPLSELIHDLWPIFKVGMIAFIIGTVITFIPIVGQIIANSPGIQSFIEGVIIFRIFSNDAIQMVMTGADATTVYPGILESIGFC